MATTPMTGDEPELSKARLRYCALCGEPLALKPIITSGGLPAMEGRCCGFIFGYAAHGAWSRPIHIPLPWWAHS